MSITVTLNFSDVKNASGKIEVENENIIKYIFPHFDADKGVTQAEFQQLQNIAMNTGKTDVLEKTDFSDGKNRLKSDIIKGDASIEGKILSLLQGGGWNSYIYVNIPKGTTMAEIKEKYNLPDGALNNYCKQAGCPGGNKDKFKTIANQVWFSAEAFAKKNNMTLEEVEKLFAE